ncbi:MAG: hypothetical protein Q7S40_29945 [Opitutaceae bacterium]|nr:hypothetical protein [Opitutaceae bacterium]
MSVAEIKAEMAKLPPAEIVHLAAFARHLARRNESGYAAGLDADREQLEKGDRISGAELRRLAGELDRAGL